MKRIVLAAVGCLWFTSLAYRGQIIHKTLRSRLERGQTVFFDGNIWVVVKVVPRGKGCK